MMFREGADVGHKCMRFVLKLTGGLFKAGGAEAAATPTP